MGTSKNPLKPNEAIFAPCNMVKAEVIPAPQNGRFTLAKFLARSFLLPLGGIGAVIYVLNMGLRGGDLKWACLTIMALVGIFNASEMVKTAITEWVKASKKGGTA